MSPVARRSPEVFQHLPGDIVVAAVLLAQLCELAFQGLLDQILDLAENQSRGCQLLHQSCDLLITRLELRPGFLLLILGIVHIVF